MFRLYYCRECSTCVKLSNGLCSVCNGTRFEEYYIGTGTNNIIQARVNNNQSENQTMSRAEILELLPNGISPTSKNLNQEKVCPVCLDDFIHPSPDKIQSIIVGKCGHPVHHQCMRRWLLNSMKNACPVCLRKVL